jgi:hypothetical protein
VVTSRELCDSNVNLKFIFNVCLNCQCLAFNYFLFKMFLLEIFLHCGIKLTSVTSLSLPFIILLNVIDNYLCSCIELFTFDELLPSYLYINTFLFTFSEFRLIHFIIL